MDLKVDGICLAVQNGDVTLSLAQCYAVAGTISIPTSPNKTTIVMTMITLISNSSFFMLSNYELVTKHLTTTSALWHRLGRNFGKATQIQTSSSQAKPSFFFFSNFQSKCSIPTSHQNQCFPFFNAYPTHTHFG